MCEGVILNFPFAFGLYVKGQMGFVGLAMITAYLTFQKIDGLIV